MLLSVVLLLPSVELLVELVELVELELLLLLGVSLELQPAKERTVATESTPAMIFFSFIIFLRKTNWDK